MNATPYYEEEDQELSPEDLFELEMVDEWVEKQAELHVMEIEQLRFWFHEQQRLQQQQQQKHDHEWTKHESLLHHELGTSAGRRSMTTKPRFQGRSSAKIGKKQGFGLFQPQ